MAERRAASKAPTGNGTPQEVHKPYTTPEGYKAPAMSELWLYVR